MRQLVPRSNQPSPLGGHSPFSVSAFRLEVFLGEIASHRFPILRARQVSPFFGLLVSMTRGKFSFSLIFLRLPLKWDSTILSDPVFWNLISFVTAFQILLSLTLITYTYAVPLNVPNPVFLTCESAYEFFITTSIFVFAFSHPCRVPILQQETGLSDLLPGSIGSPFFRRNRFSVPPGSPQMATVRGSCASGIAPGPFGGSLLFVSLLDYLNPQWSFSILLRMRRLCFAVPTPKTPLLSKQVLRGDFSSIFTLLEGPSFFLSSLRLLSHRPFLTSP